MSCMCVCVCVCLCLCACVYVCASVFLRMFTNVHAHVAAGEDPRGEEENACTNASTPEVRGEARSLPQVSTLSNRITAHSLRLPFSIHQDDTAVLARAFCGKESCGSIVSCHRQERTQRRAGSGAPARVLVAGMASLHAARGSARPFDAACSEFCR